MFTGLSAFPITPFKNEQLDISAFTKIVDNLVSAKVDSICAMGSTGLYPYLNLQEKRDITQKTVQLADGIPVMVGIGSLRTLDVLKNAEAAQQAGAKALLLAPVSYHPLKDAEVFSLYEQVCKSIDVPLCIYENPGVTNFAFSDQLYGELSQLPNIGAIKIPGTPFASDEGKTRLAQLRSLLPEHIAIGVSGDKFAAAGMSAGCDLWLSVFAGTFPKTAQQLLSLAQSETPQHALALSEQLQDLWSLFVNNKGGMRVMATAADILGYTEADCLPHPLSPLEGQDRKTLETVITKLTLDTGQSHG